MKKILIILLITLGLFTIINKNEKSNKVIPNESIRFRIIANSNDPKDQVAKMNLVSEIYPTLINSTKEVKTIDEARKNIKSSTKELETIIEKYTNNYDINYGNNYFPEKIFEGNTYKEGNYESLVISLGESKGDNWWCVLFPPLCLLEAEETNKDDIEYKSFFYELANKYLK